jgi:hypothetical protein
LIREEAKPMADRDLFDIKDNDAKQRAVAAARALPRESVYPWTRRRDGWKAGESRMSFQRLGSLA